MIGYGSLNQGEEKVHGSPLSGKKKKEINTVYVLLSYCVDADIKQVKEKFGFNGDEKYSVPQEVDKSD